MSESLRDRSPYGLMSNDNRSGAAPSAQMSHAELIAEQLTNIESLGDTLPAVIAAGSLRKLLRHLDEAHKRELDAKDSVIQSLSSELRQLQEEREITIAAQKAKAAAEGYADGKRDPQGENSKMRDALVEIVHRLSGEDDSCLFHPMHPDDQDALDAIYELAKSALATVGKE